MNEKITLYQKSTCTKCRTTKKILDEAGVEYEDVLYYETPMSEEKLKELLSKLEMSARELIRKGESVYRELNLKDEYISDDELIKVMIKNPDLIERPIIERGNKAVLGRPPENVKELL